MSPDLLAPAPTPRLRRKPAGLVAALVAALLLLAACQKPTPDIGVLSGSTYRSVSPSTYCFSASSCHSGRIDLPTVTVDPDAKVLVDVPRQVEVHGWEVRALTLDGQKQLGASGRIDDRHSYTVASTVNGGCPFIAEVRQFSGSSVDSSRWSFVVQVSGAGAPEGRCGR